MNNLVNIWLEWINKYDWIIEWMNKQMNEPMHERTNEETFL